MTTTMTAPAPPAPSVSVFAKYTPKAYPHNYRAQIRIHRIAGGIPSDPNVAEGWLKSKLGVTDERVLQQAVSEVMLERACPADEAIAIVNKNKNLNGFKRFRCPSCPPTGDLCADGSHELYFEGRCLKSAIKEAANVRWPYPHKWGKYKNTKDKEVGGKASPSFFAEHVFVDEDKITLGCTEPTGVMQRFVHTRYGAGISYEEYCDDVTLQFTVVTDWPFTEQEWAYLWLTGEWQGVGATRSQGFGRYCVVGWDKL